MTKTKTAKAKALQKRKNGAKPQNGSQPPKQPKVAKKVSKRSGGMALSYAQNVSPSVGKSNIQSHLTGKDIIYEVRTGAAPYAGALVTLVVNLNPNTILAGTRLRQFAPLFQRFRFTKFVLRYLPVVNVEYIGQAICAYVADPTQDLTGTDLSLVQNVTQLAFKGMFNCWKGGTFSVRPSDMVTAPGMKFCCDPTEEADNVETYQGKLYFISDNLTTANTLYGRWELDWGVEFYDPIITKALNATFLVFNSNTATGQSSPWGQASSGNYIGDSSLATLSYSGTDSVLTFPDNGEYLIEVYYPGSASTGLTSSSTIAAGTGGTIVSSYIAYTNAQTGKFWRVDAVVPDNGTVLCHDSAGTHSGAVTIEVLRIGPGPAASLAQASKKSLSKKIASLEDQLNRVLKMVGQTGAQAVVPPPFPSYPGIQLAGEAQSSTSVVGEISDGNNPLKTVVVEESESSAIGPEIVGAPVEKKKRKMKKFVVLNTDDDEDSE